jgi:hypothetical protein
MSSGENTSDYEPTQRQLRDFVHAVAAIEPFCKPELLPKLMLYEHSLDDLRKAEVMVDHTNESLESMQSGPMAEILEEEMTRKGRISLWVGYILCVTETYDNPQGATLQIEKEYAVNEVRESEEQQSVGYELHEDEKIFEVTSSGKLKPIYTPLQETVRRYLKAREKGDEEEARETGKRIEEITQQQKVDKKRGLEQNMQATYHEMMAVLRHIHQDLDIKAE